jgi:hypothetical protein
VKPSDFVVAAVADRGIKILPPIAGGATLTSHLPSLSR